VLTVDHPNFVFSVGVLGQWEAEEAGEAEELAEAEEAGKAEEADAAASNPLSPDPLGDSLITSKASEYLHALSSDLKKISPGIAFNVFLELMQRIHQNVRKTLFRFRWDIETIPLGH
jgi:hypothetical protein